MLPGNIVAPDSHLSLSVRNYTRWFAKEDKMFLPFSRRCLSLSLVVAMALTIVFAQSKPSGQKPNQQKPATTTPETPPQEPQDIETLKTDTDLVTVPVTATDRGGIYITDLRQEEFTITEDGVQQQIAFFGKVAAPFHVVLMLDTSSSTQDKLKQIQDAANAFVQQLQPADRVKVISFDDSVRDLNEFTSNRSVLSKAIYDTRSGAGNQGLRRGRTGAEHDSQDSRTQSNRDLY